ncbi:MAG: PAS domain-containing protein, partial [Rhizobiales bacterium]|nr:PAS domain-containing protein [Rhizobacter sp.]
RLAFLDELIRATRELNDAATVMTLVARRFGEYLQATRCAYADVDADNDRFTIRSDWSVDGVPSSTGVYSLDLFGPLAASNLRNGRPLIVNDVDAELGDGGGARMFNAIGIKAIICGSLVKEGRLVALMAVHQAKPRDWTDDDVALVEEVVDRCWSHIERIRDAAERDRAVAQLQASEARLQAITDSIDQMVWSTRPDGFHDFYNQRWYEYTGVPAGSTDGEGWNDMFHPADQERAWATWRESLATGKPYHIEYRLRHHSGRYRWVLGRAQPVLDAHGRITRWYGTCTDIQDIVDARELLTTSRADLEQIVEQRTRERDQAWKHSQDLQAVLDEDGFFLAANNAWQTILGWAPAEVVGQSHLRFNHASHQAQSQQALAVAARGTLPAYETLCLHKDGSTRWISWVAAPEGNLIYASGRDVTHDKAAAAALEATQQQLRQSQKMEAVGQLTGGIAHDFNNLLAGTSASLEVLSKRIAQGRYDAVDKYIGMAKVSVRRAATLTQRLLAFSRRQTLDPKPTDVNRLIAGVEELIRSTVGPQIQVEVVGAGGLWPANIDAMQLENALLNLCINARDAMAPHGGRLTIETANRWLDDRSALEHGLPPGQYLSVCVTDTGAGMTPEVAARAFDPFFTTKPLGQGTGLGLSMIYGFVRQSGGHVRIYTELGLGTTMCMYFPRHLGSAVEAEADAVNEAAAAGESGTVLVIDDEVTLRMLLVEVLEEAGYRVIAAQDGPSGLAVLQSEQRVDLLITDVGLPGGMNGRQVADAARIWRPELKVMFITGYAENAAVGNGYLAPGMTVITKPFELATLVRKAVEILDN